MTSCCQCAAPPAESPAKSRSRSADRVRVAFAAAVAAQSMIFSLAVNLSPPAGTPRLVIHAALALSALVVFALVGGPLLRAAIRPRIVFEQLFLAGILSAFAASLVSTFTGIGHVYYEIVALLLAIHTFGRLIGDGRRRAALDAARLLGAEFASGERCTANGATVIVPVADIRAGDLVHVPAGGGIPVDGAVAEGIALVNEATLTGQPFPVVRRPGDAVLAGSRLVDGPLRVRASGAGGTRLLDALFARVRSARARPSRLEREADRVVAWFLPAVILVAGGTFVFWAGRDGWAVGMFNALAVLLVACPCSMGLATPIGVWSALGDLTRKGIVPATSDLVERMAAVRQVVFDKTGTLGEERLEIVDLVCAPGIPRSALLDEVAAIEAASSHPVARSFRRAVPFEAENLENIAGVGVEGRVNGVRLRVGNASVLAPDHEAPAAALRPALVATAATREIYIVREGALAGIALLRERLREATRGVIADLEDAGVRCIVLTGDATAHDLARAETGLSPLEKAARVRALADDGPVLFVGDGVNDAAAMAESHVSLAMADGSACAREIASGEIRDLRAIPYGLARSRHAVRTIRRNLLFAAAYNIVGIALAAAGILHPIAAALLMLASSFTVSWRALRRSECALAAAPGPIGASPSRRDDLSFTPA